MNALSFTPTELEARLSQSIIHESWTTHEGAWLWLSASTPQMNLLAPTHHPFLARLPASTQPFDSAYVLMSAPMNHETLAALQGMLTWLNPQPLGLKCSFGFGDRLGLATRGHVLALQRTHAAYPHADIAPIFAQQSIREMARTARDPQQVMADAVWGIFGAGWRGKWGADADHLKTPHDIDSCAAQGFTFFTLDPSAFVQDHADSLNGEALESAALTLDWARLETTYHETQQRYANRRFDVADTYLSATQQEVARAAVKYGGAIAHVSLLYRHLTGLNRPFEVEISLDETDTPTTAFEHFYAASELKRLGVQWVSLAPHFVGRFEKGVDYIGDLQAVARDFEIHAAVARTLGPYKLSLHSGSDKFSIYAAAAHAADGLLHVKTAGTSYLEALRVLASQDTDLFREIARLAWTHCETDRQTYHVSLRHDALPTLDNVADADLAALLDEHHARQALHVTFGTVLREYQPRIHAALERHAAAYAEGLAQHFSRHLTPILASQP